MSTSKSPSSTSTTTEMSPISSGRPKKSQHLKSIHPAVMNEFSKKEEIVKKCKLEEEAKKQETSLKQYRQSTLKQSFNRHTVYPKDSNQYKAITRKLAIFVGSSSVANSIVENLEFVDLLNTINPRYSVPGRAAIHRELDLVLIELRANILRVQTESVYAAMCGPRKV